MVGDANGAPTDLQQGRVPSEPELDSALSKEQWPVFAEVQPPKLNLRRAWSFLEAQSHPPCVVVDPKVMRGTPCLAGSRLPARTLLGMIDRGDAWERIVEGWPWLTPGHVKAARAWFADSGNGRGPNGDEAEKS